MRFTGEIYPWQPEGTCRLIPRGAIYSKVFGSGLRSRTRKVLPMRAVLRIVAAIVVVAALRYMQLQQAAVEWENAKEIVSESIVQEDRTWKI